MESLAPLLPALVCPVAMGLMMWVMMRSGKDSSGSAVTTKQQSIDLSDDSPNASLADLRAQLRAIEVEQADLAAQLSELESSGQATNESMGTAVSGVPPKSVAPSSPN